MTSEAERMLDVSIEVNAPASVVWRALTEAEELRQARARVAAAANAVEAAR
jgi:hypothetical protein